MNDPEREAAGRTAVKPVPICAKNFLRAGLFLFKSKTEMPIHLEGTRQAARCRQFRRRKERLLRDAKYRLSQGGEQAE